MIINIMDLQDRVQDSMLSQNIPDYDIERAIDIVHEKVAVLIYCAQRIEYAIRNCQEWEGRNDSYISDMVNQWLVQTCKAVDLDKLYGIEVKVVHNKDRAKDPISLEVEFLYNNCPHLVFDEEANPPEQLAAYAE